MAGSFFMTRMNNKRVARNYKNPKRLPIQLGTITADISDLKAFSFPYAVEVIGVGFESSDGQVVDASDYINFELTNIGLDGTGTDVIVDKTDDANTTEDPDGTAIVADVASEFTLTEANVNVAANEMVKVDIDVTGTISLSNSVLYIDYEDNLG